MPASQMSEVIQLLRREALREGAGVTDGQLLESYVGGRDEAALEALVRRHGPMVWGVCRRVLGNYHDAEDAFQATFLVLVRKAGSIMPREMVANWLHGVAHQTAWKARATAARRTGRERQVTEVPEPAVTIALGPIPSKRVADRNGAVGVAFWADVDGAAKDFTLFVNGLTNAWSSEGDRVRRKVLKVGFRRVGNEMVPTGPAEWAYRSYERKPAEEARDHRLEVEGLIGQLTSSIADLEAERKEWKEKRQLLRDRARETRHLADNPPADLAKEDRATVVRALVRRAEELERQIASGDRKDTSHEAALESYRQRLEQLRQLLVEVRDRPTPE